MSNIYNLEPVTKGKVLLTTSHGDIEIELWAREAPKACRNFVQLCLEGYYDSTIFHRLVKGFCIQGGDPTGTGKGGESIYGEEFVDEFHQRLKFQRRGLVAMANSGEPNTNTSQFFVTLGEAPELQRKHTIFGKVSGNTIYNVLRMAELETDNEEKPLEPPSIKKTEILSNPFEDITPRDIRHKTEEVKEQKKKKKSQMKATKNFKLLSFGDEAEGDEDETQQVTSKLGKIASAHDRGNDPKLSKTLAISAEQLEGEREQIQSQAEKIRQKLKKEIEDAKPIIEDFKSAKQEKLNSLKRESEQLLNDIKDIGKEDKEEQKKEAEKDGDLDENEKETVNTFRRELKEFKEKKQNEKITSKSEREKQTLSFLAKFKTKLKESTDTPEQPELRDDVEGEEEEDILNNINLFSHSLVDVERTAKVKDANVVDDDTFDIYDPRHPINERKRQKGQKRAPKSDDQEPKWKRGKLLT